MFTQAYLMMPTGSKCFSLLLHLDDKLVGASDTAAEKGVLPAFFFFNTISFLKQTTALKKLKISSEKLIVNRFVLSWTS